MFLHKSLLAALGFSLTAYSALAGPTPEEVKNTEHGKLLEQLYLTASLRVLFQNDVPYQTFQDAINDAYRAGVPRTILNEFVATRALRKADAASLQQLLPGLKAALDTYRPETSVFADREGAAMMVKVIETTLAEEQRTPGTLAIKAKFATEMALARTVRAQLVSVDALVDYVAIKKGLAAGTAVPEAQWRAGAQTGSRFSTMGADELGNAFGTQKVDQPPTVPKASYERLKGVVPDSFWAPFGIPK